MRASALAVFVILAFLIELSWADDKVTDWGYIVQLRTGWIEDTMAVFTSSPVVNPGCSVTNAGYATNPNDPGHKLHHAALLGAYFNNKRVQIIVRDCVYDKPRIIAVHVMD
jgi:hypothetical protein